MFAQVIISGSTASAYVLKGKQWETLQADRHEDWRACPHQQVANITSLTQDWTLLEKPKLDYVAVKEMLRVATAKHDVLHFCLMGLDAEYSDALRYDALDYCETLLADATLRAHLEGILFSTAVPDSADLVGAIALAQDTFPILYALLHQLGQVREQVSSVTQVWQQFVSPAFQDEAVKIQVRQGLIDNAYFKQLCLQLAHPERLNLDRLLLDHSKLSKPIPKVNVAVVLQEFHAFLQEAEAIGINRLKARQPRIMAEKEEQGGNVPVSLEDQTLVLLKYYVSKGGRPLTRVYFNFQEVKQKVSIDIQGIESAIQEDNLALAKQLFCYLLQYQTAHSFTENILKTCTNVLNLARKAANWDFMSTVLQFAEALNATDVVFLTSKAEVHKAQGRLHDALKAYEKVIKGHPTDVVTQNGRAEVLKALGRLHDALHAYNAVISAHPQDVVAQNGRAEVLKAQGRLKDALQAYDAVISAHPQNVVAQSGRAEVLKALGRLHDALHAYDAVINAHPQNVVAHTGRAEVLKAQGRLKDALHAYDAVISANPQNVVAQSGRAEVLKAQGRLDDALGAYDHIIKIHPKDVVAQTGRLSILLIKGTLSHEDRKSLLDQNPEGLHNWVRYHLGCMALIFDGYYQTAIEKLEWGLQNNPFGLEKPYFISALATAYIGTQEFRQGIQLLESLEMSDQSAIAKARARILKAHALFAEQKQSEGIQILNALDSSEYPLLRRAKSALEARYVANPSPEHIPTLDEEIRIIEFQLLIA